MKITIYCDSGANIHSRWQSEYTTEELGFSEAEWAELSEEEKWKIAEEVVQESGRLDIGYWEGDK